MGEDSSRGKSLKARTDASVIRLPTLDEPNELTPMNFRVPAHFHREFKLYAVQHGISMVDLLQESFRLMKSRKR